VSAVNGIGNSELAQKRLDAGPRSVPGVDLAGSVPVFGSRPGSRLTDGVSFADFSRKSNYDDAGLNALYPFLGTQLEMMKLGDGKVVRPPAPIYTSLEGVYGLQINQAMTGAVTPEQALETTQTLFQNILSGNQMIPYNVDSFDDTLDNTKALIASLSSM